MIDADRPRRNPPRSAFKVGDGRPRGPKPTTALEVRLARRAERLAVRATSARIETGIAEALVHAPAIICEMARRALEPGASKRDLLDYGDRVTALAAKLADLEVERLRALNPGATAAVQVNFPSLSEIDRRIAELRGLRGRCARW